MLSPFLEHTPLATLRTLKASSMVHILLNGLSGLELQEVELIRCLPDITVFCAVDVIADSLEP